MAAKYAGLGTIGASHNLLTPEFGPRVRLVSVFTEAALPPDPPAGKEPCIRCAACARCCPKNAIRMREDRVIADYDKAACLEMTEGVAEWSRELRDAPARRDGALDALVVDVREVHHEAHVVTTPLQVPVDDVEAYLLGTPAAG